MTRRELSHLLQCFPANSMRLSNETPFSLFFFEAYGQRDELLNVVFCRGTFDLQADGRLSIAAEQQPVVLADQYHAEPLVSSVQVDTDLVPHKFAADITLNAIAHAPHCQTATTWSVGVRVGRLFHNLRVTGPRRWGYSLLSGWQLARPEPTLSVPIQYEYAFGGCYKKGNKELDEVVFEQNPVGRGFAHPRYADPRQTFAAPQIELSHQPIIEFGRTYEPAGFGPIAKHWLPRRELSGTADQHWKDTRWPLRPLDFDFCYYNSAPPSLVYPGYLHGDEPVQLTGLHPDGAICFDLPGIAITLFALDRNQQITLEPMRLDTLHIDTIVNQIYLTWRLSFPRAADLTTVQIVKEPLRQHKSSIYAEAEHG